MAIERIADLRFLDPEFRVSVEALKADLADQGHVFHDTETLRTPWRQARLYRQSRVRAKVDEAIATLRVRGAEYLAWVMEDVGPQDDGPHVTNALPGFGWHAWGEGDDLVHIVGGHAVYDVPDPDRPGHTKMDPAYLVLATTARKHGLKSGLDFGDDDHVQKRMTEPTALPWPDVDAEMERRYGRDELAWFKSVGL